MDGNAALACIGKKKHGAGAGGEGRLPTEEGSRHDETARIERSNGDHPESGLARP